MSLEQAEKLHGAGNLSGAIETLSDFIRLQMNRDDHASNAEVIAARILRGKLLVAHAENLRARPAADSELENLYGHDLPTLCEMAVADANRVLLSDPSNHEAHMLRVEAATAGLPRQLRSFAIEALSYYPGNDQLIRILSDVTPLNRKLGRSGGVGNEEGVSSTSNGDEEEDNSTTGGDAFDCVLCLKLFLEPITTACGHTFCRHCLAAALDHTVSRNQACPLCRTPLHMDVLHHPVTALLQRIIEENFAQQLIERRKEFRATADHRKQEERGGDSSSSVLGHNDETTIPVFVLPMSITPGHTTMINVFEPRYRLLIRRCLQGSGVFGMTGSEEGGSGNTVRLQRIGVSMKILESNIQSDGRIVITIRAFERFEVMDSWELDGYVVAKVRRYRDTAVGAGPELDETEEMCDSLIAAFRKTAMGSDEKRFPLPTLGRSSADKSSGTADVDPTTLKSARLELLSLWLTPFFLRRPEQLRSALEEQCTLNRLRGLKQ